MKTTTKQWLWFAGLWFGGLFAVAGGAYAIKLLMRALGLLE